MRTSVIGVVVVVVAGISALSPTTLQQVTQGAEVTHASGGSIRTVLMQTIALNDKSTLTREWTAVKHYDMPARFVGTPGIRTIYESGQYSGDYRYTAALEIDVTEALAAVEIRFLTFDIWGEHMKSLSLTEIRDMAKGTHQLGGKWSLFSENEASEFYASIAYVSRVRTSDGRVLIADSRAVLDEAKKFSSKFTESDLEPEKPRTPEK